MNANGTGLPEKSAVVIPRLVCRDPAAAIDFYLRTFDAIELGRRPGPDGDIAHALLTIGPGMIMVEREWETLPSRAPVPDGSSPVVIFLYLRDVDSSVERALAFGATLLLPAKDQFWGDRTAWIMDPAGHVWTLATRIEELPEEERQARWTAMMAGQERDEQGNSTTTRPKNELG